MPEPTHGWCPRCGRYDLLFPCFLCGKLNCRDCQPFEDEACDACTAQDADRSER